MKQVTQTVAQFMNISAITAPKAGGSNYLKTKILEEQEIKKLADAMIKYGKENKKKNFDRDGENVKKSSAVLIISLNEAKALGLNCGACGYNNCNDLEMRKGEEFDGPVCAWRLIDLGIALGSAVKTAALFNVDNRIMYRIGAVAKKEKIIDGEIVVGIPISITGKNIYFDR
ncbi:ferredoxin domain-containing protein [Halanaerobium sp. MA284_MarDTE_T2]|uniref:ferredoxin domain-containing protein n=1 Tax=Halanaerobium sp. MA284_MarDTE_T2 TaxID=2183913 RepID=UPI000DF43762|nr:DUF2148 domain-containing protein [Halanaerobium sp. MA284_MarDTE_T2]RCW48644.1 putative ferredoxin-like protein [Halanaerobium sp. MA284_MarDTE_T2]